jgi:predicted enzyme related to lactoylglutathione lyase
MPAIGPVQKRVSSPDRVGQPHPDGVVPTAGTTVSRVITGLDHVQVAAPPGSEAEARGFYGALLGLIELEKPAPLAARGGAWFACGAQQLHVGVAADFTPAGKAHPALAVAAARDLDVLAERLTLAGAPVLWDTELPDVRRFYTEDPWGNRLELLAPS